MIIAVIHATERLISEGSILWNQKIIDKGHIHINKKSVFIILFQTKVLVS